MENDIQVELGRIIAGSYYDHQEVRITEFNRIRDILRRTQEGIPLVGEVEEKKDEEEKYKNKFVDKKIPEVLNKLLKEGKLTPQQKEYLEAIFQVQKNAERYENEYKKLLMKYVENELIYKEFLQHIKGISAVLSANLIKELTYCEKPETISDVWKYFGYHVQDGIAEKRKKGQKLSFSSKRRQLGWKIGDSFIKQRTPVYREIYDSTKESEQAKSYEIGFLKKTYPNAKYKEEDIHISLNHAHYRAIRKMVKIFLANYWMACKEIYNKPQDESNPLSISEPLLISKPRFHSVSKPYAEEKLGHKHIIDWKYVVQENLRRKDETIKANVNQ